MSRKILSSAVLVICVHLMVITPVVCAGVVPVTLTVFSDEPDPGQAHYGYVVSFDLEAETVMEFPPAMTGTITASDGQDECTATLPELNCVLIPSTPGTLTINASYSGDGNYAADNADSISHEVLPFQLPEVVSRGEGLGPGLFPNHARDIAISADGQHVAVGVSTPSIYIESGKTPVHGVFVYDIPDRSWELVSVNSDGTPGGGNSYFPGAAYAPSISANGRWVAFEAFHSDLGGADPADGFNVYLFDRDSGTLHWVSEDMNGGHGHGRAPSVSDDGRFVAFQSTSSNLVPGDTNGFYDVFVWDRTDDSLKIVSVDNEGNQGTGRSEAPSISADGNFVAFQSDADNLLDTTDDNNKTDIFVFNLLNDTIERVSLDSVGAQGAHDSEAPSISGDGRYIVFEGHRLTPHDNGYFQIYRRDRILNSTILASKSDSGDDVFADHHRASISDDGQFVTFETNGSSHVTDDTNGEIDTFIRDIELQKTKRISMTADGSQANGPNKESDVSADGLRTVFLSSAPNLVESPVGPGRYFPVVHDPGVGTRQSIRISASPAGSIGNGDSGGIAMSFDGRFAVFSSTANNLVPGDTNGVADIFIRDRQGQSLERLSLTSTGEQGNWDSLDPAISADGRFIVFVSKSFSAQDRRQVYLVDRSDQSLTLVSKSAGDDPGNADSIRPTISADGNIIAFYSKATNLVSVDTNESTADLYIYNAQDGTIIRVISPGDSGAATIQPDQQPVSSFDGRYTGFVTGASEVWIWDRIVGALIPTQNDDGLPLRSTNGHLSMSADGNLLAFNILVGNCRPDCDYHLIVYDFSRHEWDIVAVNEVLRAELSNDGRFLVGDEQRAGGYDVYIYDLIRGARRLLSRNLQGTAATGASWHATISPDGQFIGFESSASDLVSNDSNGRIDAFIFKNPFLGVLFSDSFEDDD